MSSNDDHRSGDGTNIRNSRLPNRVLDAGVYTVSASTYRSERTGAFEVQLTACVANDVLLSRVCYPPLDPANGGPTSPTDCSRAYVYTWSHAHGNRYQMRTIATNSNFGPGNNAHVGPGGGVVACDTLTRKIVLSTTDDEGQWTHYTQDIETNQKTAIVIAWFQCGLAPRCKNIRHQFFESEYNWVTNTELISDSILNQAIGYVLDLISDLLPDLTPW